jgi:hypothetical protein
VRWESARTGRGCRRRSPADSLLLVRMMKDGLRKCTLLRGEAAPFLGGRRCADCCKPCRKIEVEDKTLVVRWNTDRTIWDVRHKSISMRRTVDRVGRVEERRDHGTLCVFSSRHKRSLVRQLTPTSVLANHNSDKKTPTSLPRTERDMAQTQDGRSDPLRCR